MKAENIHSNMQNEFIQKRLLGRLRLSDFEIDPIRNTDGIATTTAAAAVEFVIYDAASTQPFPAGYEFMATVVNVSSTGNLTNGFVDLHDGAVALGALSFKGRYHYIATGTWEWPVRQLYRTDVRGIVTHPGVFGSVEVEIGGVLIPV